MIAKQLDIRNRAYYFYNDLINLSHFSVNNLKLNKKTWKDIGYVVKNKLEEWKVNSVNPLYLIINKVFCFVEEENGVKYLKIDRIGNFLDLDVLTKWNQIFNGIKYHINKLSNEEVNFNSNYDKIKFVSNDSLPLGKLIYFPTLPVVFRCVFKQGDVFYPQIYLDNTLYQL